MAEHRTLDSRAISQHELGHILSAAVATVALENMGVYPADTYSKMRVYACASAKGGEVGTALVDAGSGQRLHEAGNDRLAALSALGPLATDKAAAIHLWAYAKSPSSAHLKAMIDAGTCSTEDLQAASEWEALQPSQQLLPIKVLAATALLWKALGPHGQSELTSALLEATSRQDEEFYLSEWVPEDRAAEALRLASEIIG